MPLPFLDYFAWQKWLLESNVGSVSCKTKFINRSVVCFYSFHWITGYNSCNSIKSITSKTKRFINDSNDGRFFTNRRAIHSYCPPLFRVASIMKKRRFPLTSLFISLPTLKVSWIKPPNKTHSWSNSTALKFFMLQIALAPPVLSNVSKTGHGYPLNSSLSYAGVLLLFYNSVSLSAVTSANSNSPWLAWCAEMGHYFLSEWACVSELERNAELGSLRGIL